MKTRTLLILPCIILFSFTTAYSQDFEPMVQKAKAFYDNKQYDSAAIFYQTALPLIEKAYGPYDTTY